MPDEIEAEAEVAESAKPQKKSTKQKNYDLIIERIFFDHYTEGAVDIAWERPEIVTAADAVGVPRPGNLGDVILGRRTAAADPGGVRGCCHLRNPFFFGT